MSDETQEHILSHCLASLKAQEAIEGYMACIDNTIYFNEEDWEFFMGLIDNPPEHNDKLKALLSKNS